MKDEMIENQLPPLERLQFYFIASVLCWRVFWDVTARNLNAYRLTHYVLYYALLLFVYLGGS